MKAKKIRLYLQAQQAERESLRCPPHDFDSSISHIDKDGVHAAAIYCKACGDIRPLDSVGVGAPAMELLPTIDGK